MAGIVWTEKNKCKQCYTCVRQCEVKAVRVKNGQAEVLTERCISCKCESMLQNAKMVKSGIKETLDILSQKQFVAAWHPVFLRLFRRLAKMIAALKALGFDEAKLRSGRTNSNGV